MLLSDNNGIFGKQYSQIDKNHTHITNFTIIFAVHSGYLMTFFTAQNVYKLHLTQQGNTHDQIESSNGLIWCVKECCVDKFIVYGF